MKNFMVNIPLSRKDFFNNEYKLTEDDVDLLKNKAEKEGRSLRVYLAYHLKKLANGEYK